MAVFERYKIERYKEILTNQPSGLVSDGGFSTYSLDDPSVTPNGTGDFLGIIKTVVLLGEVYKETIDIRNMSFNEFNNLTQTQFDDYVRQGMILLNRQTNGQPERIGWVEIGRSHASFYYQSCSGGKRPVSEHYFDIQEFAFDNRTVIGEGSEIEPTEALTPIGNFDPNIANNLGVLRPGFEPLNLTDYIRFAMVGTITNINGESIRINDLSLTDQTRPTQVSLLMANRGDHFDNQFANEVSIGKWGMIRRTISESLKPGVHVIYSQYGLSLSSQGTPYSLDFSRNEGQCLQTTIITSTGGGAVVTGGTGVTTTPQTGGTMRPPMSITDEDILFNDKYTKIPWDVGKINPVDRQVKVTRDQLEKTCFSLIHDFPKSLKDRLVFSQNSIDLSQISGLFATGNSKNGLPPSSDFGILASRLKYQIIKLINGEIPFVTSDVPDLMDTVDLPRGSLRKEINPNTGCIEITYIGTPVTDYIGPELLLPTEFGLDESDEPTPLIWDDGNTRVDSRGRTINPFSQTELYWMKRRGATIYAQGGRGWWDRMSSSGGSGKTAHYGDVVRLIEISEQEMPIYMYASDQKWNYKKSGTIETKSLSIENRGGTTIIITDYRARGNANFINVGLLDVLPVVLNPGEILDFEVDYVPRTTGLQTWKGKNDPFPALLTEVAPENYLIIDYTAYARLPQLGFVPIDGIPDDPRPSDRWRLSKRNKLWSKLELITTNGGK
jgi:hypothetical protein